MPICLLLILCFFFFLFCLVNLLRLSAAVPNLGWGDRAICPRVLGSKDDFRFFRDIRFSSNPRPVLSFSLSLSPPFLTSVHLSWIFQQAVEWEEYLCDGKFATGFFSQATSWFLPKKGMQKKKRSRRRGFYDSQHDEENIWVDGFYGGNRWVCCCANREQFAKHKFRKGVMSWLLDSCVKRWIWVRGCGYAYGRPKT